MSRLTSGGRGAARWLALGALAVAGAGLGGWFTAGPALADSAVTVTTTALESTPGDGACSLAEAIAYAQGQNGTNADCGTTATGTTTISLPAGQFLGADAHFVISGGGPGPIVIAGRGMTSTIIDGQGTNGRIFGIKFGATVILRNLTLRGGAVFSHSEDGGGIYNQGTLTLDHVTVNGNQTVPSGGYGALPGAGYGGGIFNQGGTVTAVSTTIAGNATGAGGYGGAGDDSRDQYGGGCTQGGYGGSGGKGGDGGGIYNDHGTVTLRESAVYGNTTGHGGAGGPSGSPSGAGTPGLVGQGGPGAVIYQENGQAIVQESTIASNVDGTGRRGPGAGASAGIFIYAGELTEIDTIVSQDDCYGQVKDGLAAGDGHLNLTWPTTSCPGILANPLLGPLTANGGSTQTMAIAPGSPAIDRIPQGAAAGCTQTDQRGIPRPQPASGRCDIGAYEYQP